MRFAFLLIPLLLGVLEKPDDAEAKRPQLDLLGARFQSLSGEVHRLGGAEEARPFALIFLGTECPISNRFVPRISELAVQAEEHRIDLFGVLSDPAVSYQAATEYIADRSIEFPVLWDASGELASRLAPTHVPQAFLFSRSGELVYEGAIDNRFVAVGKLRQTITENYLQDAFESVASDEVPKVAKTEPIGCIFEAWQDENDEVTFTRDIAPILNANCVDCHREGQAAPFPLTNYEQARRRARMIAQVTGERFMPPWHSKKGHGTFRNERRLSNSEIERLAQWADSGAKRGEPEELPTSVVYRDDTWELGEPDLILQTPEFTVPGDGPDVFRRFSLPMEIEEETMVVGYQYRTSAGSIVHHAMIYLDPERKGRKLDAEHDGPGYPVFAGSESAEILNGNVLGIWTPGMRAHGTPEGWGEAIQAGTDIVLSIHYHPDGRERIEQTTLGLYFAKKPVKRLGHVWFGTIDIDIEPGDANYERRAWVELPYPVHVVDLLPHMHYIGKEFRVDATLPDGTQLPLVWIEDWDLRWQDYHVYHEPMFLPAKTRLDLWMRYDNSESNWANPRVPPERVTFGQESHNEMGDCYLTVIPADEQHRVPLWWAGFASFSRAGDGR